MSYFKYKSGLLNRFKGYREKYFQDQEGLFNEKYNHVFKREFAEYNLFKPELDELLAERTRRADKIAARIKEVAEAKKAVAKKKEKPEEAVAA